MTARAISDEVLMAYADGELDREEAARVEAALAGDPELGRRLAVFTRTREVLAQAARARGTPELPEELMARVRQTLAAGRPPARSDATVIPFRRRVTAMLAAMPRGVAASVALAVGVAGGLLGGLALRDEPGVAEMGIALLPSTALGDALGSLRSGETGGVDGGAVTVIASFANSDGEFCREFEVDTEAGASLVSVACATEAGWQVRFAVVAGADSTGYAPASSLETLDAYLAAIGAGAPLDPDEEAAALAATRE